MSEPAAHPSAPPVARLTRPVVLVGLMGAGKTTVGRRLAAALGAPFVDSDEEVEAAARMSVAEIFETLGEAEFREGERRVIGRLLDEPPQVIATGGGAFMNPRTRDVISDKGATTVWLRAELDVLLERVGRRSGRPLLERGDPREILAGLMATRHPVYALADVVVDSAAQERHEAVAGRIIDGLAARGDLLRSAVGGEG